MIDGGPVIAGWETYPKGKSGQVREKGGVKARE